MKYLKQFVGSFLNKRFLIVVVSNPAKVSKASTFF